ncbi:MAG: hypothetical protein SFZ24_01335 [Planctomycetota bacterium]|nr:hypothetical protein [Planctomycetota bacterium]
MRRFLQRSVLVLSVLPAAGAVWLASSAGAAQVDAPTRADNESRRETAQKLSRLITVEFTDARLEDIITFAADFSGAEVDPIWSEENSGAPGLDREQRLTLSVKDITVLQLIERVLAKATSDLSPATWQFAPSGGALQIGPRSALNRFAFMTMYDIQDLIYQIPNFTDMPELDLDQVLQQARAGGGGGGGSVFSEEDDSEPEFKPSEEMAMDVINLITTNIEPEQWADNGGDGATVTFYNGFLLIRAPDYIHRRLTGYPFNMNLSRVPAPKGGGATQR